MTQVKLSIMFLDTEISRTRGFLKNAPATDNRRTKYFLLLPAMLLVIYYYTFPKSHLQNGDGCIKLHKKI